MSECLFRNQEIPPKTVPIDIKADGEGFKGRFTLMSIDGSDYGFVKLKQPITDAVPFKVEASERELKANEEIVLSLRFKRA